MHLTPNEIKAIAEVLEGTPQVDLLGKLVAEITNREADGQTVVDLRFVATCECTQSVRITDPALTPAALIAGLNDGTYCTTMDQGGTVDHRSGRKVGVVVSCDVDGNYENFEVADGDGELDDEDEIG
jgi:hypothetical protein